MNNVDGVILAAGRSSRMETGHKVACNLGRHTLLQHVIMRLQPQVDSLVINADPDICGQYSLTALSYLTLLWLTGLRVFVGH